MMRWDMGVGNFVENSDVDQFLDDIDAVCLAYGMSISHEDRQGGFRIESYTTENIKWLQDAAIGVDLSTQLKEIS